MNLEIKRRAFKHHVSMETEQVLPDEPELLKEVKEEIEVERRLSMIGSQSVAKEENEQDGVGGQGVVRMEGLKEVEEEEVKSDAEEEIKKSGILGGGVPAEKLESGESGKGASGAAKKIDEAAVGGSTGDCSASLLEKELVAGKPGKPEDGASVGAAKIVKADPVASEGEKGWEVYVAKEDGSGSSLKEELTSGEPGEASGETLVLAVKQVAEAVIGGLVGAGVPSENLESGEAVEAAKKVTETDVAGSAGDADGSSLQKELAPGQAPKSRSFEPIPSPPEITAQQWELVLAVWKAREEEQDDARRGGAPSDKKQRDAEKRDEFYRSVKKAIVADQLMKKKQEQGVVGLAAQKKAAAEHAAKKRQEFFDRVAKLAREESASSGGARKSMGAAKNADVADFGSVVGVGGSGSKDSEPVDLPPECSPIKCDVAFKLVRELVDPGNVLETHLKRHHFHSSVKEEVDAEKAAFAAKAAEKRNEFFLLVKKRAEGGSGTSGGDVGGAGTSKAAMDGSDSEHSVGDRVEDGHDGDVDTDGSAAAH